ncbi:UNVERIFIED_CONTAM: hypothetical protein HDU68_010441 [Siphonaria sp. JEL0065]|nr:hypothetical protein HDU68_010441 [Siphonaria sp. JEL0065]
MSFVKRFTFGASAIAASIAGPVIWAHQIETASNQSKLTITPFVFPETFSKPLYEQGFIANAFDPEAYRTFQL